MTDRRDGANGTGAEGTGDDQTGQDSTGQDSTGSDEVGRSEGLSIFESSASRADSAADRPPTHRATRRPMRRRAAGFGRRPVGRRIVSGVGELLLTLGVVVLLLVVYEVYVTNLFGAQKQAAATQVLDQKWERAQASEVVVTAGGTAAEGAPDGAASRQAPSSASTPPAAKQQQVDPSKRAKNYSTALGQAFAKLYIPSFGTDWTFTVIEGTDSNDLYTGPGHYIGTQYPGQPGNFAVAGHRVSKGSPFNDLGLLNSCDSIVVETQDDWFVYRVLPMQNQVAGWNAASHQHCTGVAAQTGAYTNAFGRSIVLPSDYDVVYPVPGSVSSAVPAKAERLITLTTCHPQFSDRERMIIHGVLVASYAKAPGFLPRELTAES